MYQHPIHNCIIPTKNVHVIFLTAQLSNKAKREALKRMLKRLIDVSLSGALIGVGCLTFYKMCVDSYSLIGPIEKLLGRGTSYPSLIDAGALTTAYTGIQRLAKGLKDGKKEWDRWKTNERQLREAKPSQGKLNTYREFLRKRGDVMQLGT